jgi:hypothetical protein
MDPFGYPPIGKSFGGSYATIAIRHPFRPPLSGVTMSHLRPRPATGA